MELYTHTHTHGDVLEEKQGKERKTNIELLRSLCMIMIIMSHYALHSGFEVTNELTLNNIILQIFRITQTRSRCFCINNRVLYGQK